MRNVNSILSKSGWIYFLVAGIFFSITTLTAQTTLIDPTGDGGFENGSTFAANGWNVSNSANNPWFIGTAVSTAPIAGNSAYITNDGGTTNAYTPTNNATNFFWRDISVPAGETKITLSFNWAQQGESSWDIWQVFYAPTSVNPIASATHPGSGTSNVPAAISGATYIGNGSLISGVQTATYFLPASLAGTTFRLIFSWKNETGGTQPPAAIDNISLVSDVPGEFISAATGDWNVGATWVGGIAPTAADNATIDAGHTVTINATGLAINNLTINNTGVLVYGATPSSFSVNGTLNVNMGGTFNVFQGTTGKTLTVAGNITNNGVIDISVGTTTAGNLTLNGSTVQTIGGAGSFNTSVIRNLICSNTNTSTPNIIWNFNNIKIAYNLNLTGARIELNGNKMVFGNNAAGNTLTAPIGTGFLTGGKFSRWWTTTATGTAITAGTDPTNTTSRYPFIDNSANNRAMYISRTGSLAGNVAGELAVTYTDAATMTTGLSVTDGAYTITDRYNGNWTVTTESTGYSHAGAHTVVLLGQNAYFPSNGNSRVMYAASVAGTHQNGTTTPGAQRIGLTTAQLIAGALYMGINEADIPFLSVATGDWNNPATWNKGVVPTCTDNVTIINGHNVTVNSAANVSRNVTINTGGTLTVASGDLTVGCTLNNNTLTNNGTLTVSGGTLNVNGNMVHNAGSTFNHSAGDINVDGNDNGNAATSVASGVSIVQLNSQNINWTGGMLTIVDPHANATASNSFTYTNSNAHVNVTGGHTIRFGNGVSTDPGGNATNAFRLNTWAGSNRISFYNIIINGGSGTNRYVTSAWSFGINGDLTINSGSEFRPGSNTYVNGNILNDGIATMTSTLFLASFLSGVESSSTNAQTISGSGTFRNLVASPTANLTSLTINNNNVTGVTLNVPLSVSGTLTLTQGIVNTTSTNILRLGTSTAAGTLSGGSATAYINGPFARTFPASRTAVGTYDVTTLFPVGKSTTYLPIHIDPTTTAGGPVILSGEAFTTNSGTGAAGVTGLSNNRWEALITSGAGNFTSSNIQLNDASIAASNKILQATSAAGVYGSIVPVSTYNAGPPPYLRTTGTQILSAAYSGFFAYGNLQDCDVPLDQPTSFTVSNLGTTTFTGSFTAAMSTPSHYLVVRYPTGNPPTNPANFTTYAVNNSLGTGTVRAVLTAPTTTFNETGLTAATTYDYYIYSYNNVACNGPVYNVTNPLMGMVTTCASTTGTPGTPVASAITSSSFTATWTASSTPGVNYIVEVATDAGFTSLVSGYNPLNVGMVLTTPVTGLSANTTYYVRVRAEVGGCFSVNSGTLTVLTNCTAVAPPRMEGFEDNTNGLDCWRAGLVSGTNNWAIQTAPSSDITNAFAGNRFAIKSFSTSNALIYSLPLDYSAVTNPTRVNVYLHRHASAHVNDEYRIHVNTTPSLTGATQILSLFSRTTTAPTVPSTGWYNYLIDIPVSLHGEPVVYVIFQGITTAGFSSYDLGVDDFKVEYLPLETIDWGNLQWPPSGSIYPGQSYNTFGQAYKAGITDPAGQAPGLDAWIGYNNSDTDPATWTNWIPATFNIQVGNNDEFIGTFTPNTFTPGTYYYAFRYQYNGGPYRYGGYNGGFWDGTNNVSGVLTVNPCPTFTPAAAPMSVCAGESSDISVSSGHGGYSYAWNPGSLSGAGPHTVMPSSTTTYIVTATDNAISCENTASVTVTVNPLPSAVMITPADVILCQGSNAALLTASGGTLGGSGKIGAGTNTNTTSTPFKAWWGGSRSQALYTVAELTALGMTTGSNILSIGYQLLGGTPIQMNDFEIKVGFVSNTTLGSAFISGASNIVFSNATYLPGSGTGPIDYVLSSPLVWDGTSLLLVETCFNNNNGGGVSANSLSVESSTVASGLNLYLSQDNVADVCSNLSSPTGTTNRPNLRVTHAIPTDMTWSGFTGLFTDAGASIAYMGENLLTVYALPASTTTYTATATTPAGCTSIANVQVGVEGAIVKNIADSGLHSLRSVYNCIAEGGTITYDQPTTDESILTATLDITKSVTIQGLNSNNRPEITIPSAGMNIATGKTLTLQDVDVKYNGSATFTGDGTVEINGTTVGKQ